MGTAAGLILGLRAANLKSRVISVRVTDDKFVNVKGMIKLVEDTNSLLRSLDASFPRIELSEEDIDIRHSYFGRQYALFTEEAMEAVDRMKKGEDINLDGTYTGKAFAAVVDDGKNENLRDKVVLFWNTLNSRDFSDAISAVDYRSLPQCFHRYFEEEVQPLDGDY